MKICPKLKWMGFSWFLAMPTPHVTSNKLQAVEKKENGEEKKKKGLKDMGGDCCVKQRKIYRCCCCCACHRCYHQWLLLPVKF